MLMENGAESIALSIRLCGTVQMVMFTTNARHLPRPKALMERVIQLFLNKVQVDRE